jgi:glutaminase
VEYIFPEQWIEVKGKKCNKVKLSTSDNVSNLPTANNFAAFIDSTVPMPVEPTVPTINLQAFAIKSKKPRKSTQKHVKHILLRSLEQQESAFLDKSITRAEDETTESAKRNKNNKQRISIDAKHKLQQHELNWKQ